MNILAALFVFSVAYMVAAGTGEVVLLAIKRKNPEARAYITLFALTMSFFSSLIILLGGGLEGIGILLYIGLITMGFFSLAYYIPRIGELLFPKSDKSNVENISTLIAIVLYVLLAVMLGKMFASMGIF